MLGLSLSLEVSLLDKVFQVQKEIERFESFGLDSVTFSVLHPVVSLLPNKGLKLLSTGLTSSVSMLVGGEDYKLLGKWVGSIHPIADLSGAMPAEQCSFFGFTHSNRLEYSFLGNLSYFPGGREDFNTVARQGIQDELVKLWEQVEQFGRATNERNS